MRIPPQTSPRKSHCSEAANSRTLEQVEREHIIRVLRAAGGVVSSAATSLGVPRTTLNAMMRELGISGRTFDDSSVDA